MRTTRIQIVREDAGETSVLETPLPATVVYGEYVHCPNCTGRLRDLNPSDPFKQCNMCGKVADLRAYMRRRGYDTTDPDPPPLAA